MATYKVIQDIEAEDKFVGPLTLKQFIFAAILVVCLYVMFLMYSKHVWYLTLPLLPPAIMAGFLGFPWKRDQTTETWLLAKLRFMFKPRVRVWDQSGAKNLVTITAPKKTEKPITNGLNQNQVQSRLKALANTIDTRGWAIKNIDISNYQSSGDRLLDIAPQQASIDSSGLDDVLDDNNPLSHQFASMIDISTRNYRQQITERLQQAASGIPQPALAAARVSTPANQPLTSSEQQLLQNVHTKQTTPPTTHMPTLQPISAANQQPSATMKTPVDPGILGLAKNDDLNVATIARQVNHQDEQQLGDNEVIVSLR